MAWSGTAQSAGCAGNMLQACRVRARGCQGLPRRSGSSRSARASRPGLQYPHSSSSSRASLSTSQMASARKNGMMSRTKVCMAAPLLQFEHHHLGFPGIAGAYHFIAGGQGVGPEKRLTPEHAPGPGAAQGLASRAHPLAGQVHGEGCAVAEFALDGYAPAQFIDDAQRDG